MVKTMEKVISIWQVWLSHGFERFTANLLAIHIILQTPDELCFEKSL